MDDITFCLSDCQLIDCFRHPSNIQDRTIPHSYAEFKGTETCPFAKDINVTINDCISRQAAIKALHDEIVRRRIDEDTNDDGTLDEFDTEAILRRLPSAQPEQQNKRIFQGIIVEYPTISTYPEYEGKPYFSIKYTENGQEFIGYGTYKPEVLSEYLKEYFMPSAQPRWIPVAEALPEEDGQYLITVKYKHVNDSYEDIYAEHGEWFEGKWDMFCFGHCGEVEGIIAWMPLPEPYAEREDDE